ncbi:MAG: tetratricopeptide repeat protein [Sphingomonadaceae bacterium]
MKAPYFASALLLSIIVVAPAVAAGGGGGGGGGFTPSETTPQYDPAVEYRNGVAAMEAKDYKAAKTAFDRVISAAPRDANSQYLAGAARFGLNDYKGARKFFEKAVKIDPAHIPAHQQLGLTYLKLADKVKAQGVMTQLQTLSTKCATTCPQASSLKTAIDAMTEAMTMSPAARLDQPTNLLFASSAAGDSAYLDAVSLINQGRYDDAIASLKTAQASFGAHPDILTYLGFANRKMKRFDVAEGYYRAALAIAPTHRGATEYFGELMVERGDLGGATKMLAKLEATCSFGCAESEELRRWIALGRSPHS